MDSRIPTPEEQRAKEEHVRQILSGLKTVADFATNTQGRGAIVQRVGSAAIAHGVQQLEQQQQIAKTAKVDYTDWEPLSTAALIEHRLGPDWITYEPETIIDALALTAEQLTKAFCARHVLYSRTPFTDWHVFEKVAIAANNRIPNFETTQDLAPYELAWAVEHMRRIDASTPFSEEVKNYIATLLRDAGCVLCPGALVDCQPNLDRVTSDYGHEIKHTHDNFPDDTSDPVAHQRYLRDLCAAYVAFKHHKLVKELASL